MDTVTKRVFSSMPYYHVSCVDCCNLQHNQDTQLLHHHKDLPCAIPLRVTPTFFISINPNSWKALICSPSLQFCLSETDI